MTVVHPFRQAAYARGRLQARAGATAEQIAIAEADVHTSAAALALIDEQLRRYSLTAPISGVVTSKLARAGEVASAGAPLLVVSDLSMVKLVVIVITSDEVDGLATPVPTGQDVQAGLRGEPQGLAHVHADHVSGGPELARAVGRGASGARLAREDATRRHSTGRRAAG